MVITPVTRGTDLITGQRRTTEAAPMVQALSRWRLAIGRTTLAAQAIGHEGSIMCGARDTGRGDTVKEFGSVATTLCADN